MNKLPLIFLTIVFFSCDPSTSSSNEAVSENILPDMTTKADTSGKTIPDEILGFKIGMSRDEVHRVAATRKLEKEGESREDISFKNVVFWGHQAKAITLSFTNGVIEDIAFFLKHANRATFDRAVEDLSERFGPPAIADEEDVTERKWSYNSGHFLSVRLNPSLNSLMILYST